MSHCLGPRWTEVANICEDEGRVDPPELVLVSQDVEVGVDEWEGVAEKDEVFEHFEGQD